MWKFDMYSNYSCSNKICYKLDSNYHQVSIPVIKCAFFFITASNRVRRWHPKTRIKSYWGPEETTGCNKRHVVSAQWQLLPLSQIWETMSSCCQWCILSHFVCLIFFLAIEDKKNSLMLCMCKIVDHIYVQ